MNTQAAQKIYLADYQPPAYLVDRVALTFRLHPTATRVVTKMTLRANPAHNGRKPLVLDGQALRLIHARINGVDVDEFALVTNDEGLSVAAGALPLDAFEWETETEINPAENLTLEGVYMSNGMYCTQCEAEGFRRITYFPDRPDVMTTYTVRIESDAPVLLSNGNPTASGPGWAEWHDPWPKPSYLFALVAGDLAKVEDHFTTMNGRDVTLQIWVRDGDQARCTFAMQALKASMAWDEREYGREYDLDLFMIVAVDDFNAGAMENKGLNIFNSKLVLASAETATDADFARIEAVIAHEYFHNWTGNRITCRDWFQLCLKEGLTVFRDQQFSGDMRSHALERIDQVKTLRDRQFREDAGPLAHPPRPDQFVEINNFYTTTVYEKGAEVIGMLRRIVGPGAYRAALDLYFARHDGQACTIEDWLQVFEDATGHDLAQFKRWYTDAGTPHVTVAESWDGGQYILTLAQSTPPTPGQPAKAPRVIPIDYGLLGADGRDMQTGQMLFSDQNARFVFDLPERPVASLLRGFSAPVVLHQNLSPQDRAFLLKHDSDPFNRWEAANQLAKDALVARATGQNSGTAQLVDGLHATLANRDLDPAYRALILTLPGEQIVAGAMAEAGHTPDPMAIYTARRSLASEIETALHDDLMHAHASQRPTAAFDPGAAQAGARALANTALGYLCKADPALAQVQFDRADNMTDSLAALGALVQAGAATHALATFYDRWQHDVLVMDKWFAIQASATPPDTAQAVMARLLSHPDFNWKNPNRFRAVLGAFALNNHAAFHAADGWAYHLCADWAIRLDAINPMVAARSASGFESWRRYDAVLQSHAQAALRRILAHDKVSRDMTEIVSRILGDTV